MIFMDIRPSGLKGFPIEIGLAFVQADRSITTDSRLIHHEPWLQQTARWDRDYEARHCITQDQLRQCGQSPQAVIDWLIAKLKDCIVFIDSNDDQKYLNEMFAAVGLPETDQFWLGDPHFIFDIGKEIDYGKFEAAWDIFEATPAPQRAAPDAARWAQIYIDSLRDNEPPRRIVVRNDWIRRVVIKEI